MNHFLLIDYVDARNWIPPPKMKNCSRAFERRWWIVYLSFLSTALGVFAGLPDRMPRSVQVLSYYVIQSLPLNCLPSSPFRFPRRLSKRFTTSAIINPMWKLFSEIFLFFPQQIRVFCAVLFRNSVRFPFEQKAKSRDDEISPFPLELFLYKT